MNYSPDSLLATPQCYNYGTEYMTKSTNRYNLSFTTSGNLSNKRIITCKTSFNVLMKKFQPLRGNSSSWETKENPYQLLVLLPFSCSYIRNYLSLLQNGGVQIVLDIPSCSFIIILQLDPTLKLTISLTTILLGIFLSQAFLTV